MYEANPQPTSQARGGARGRERQAANAAASSIRRPPLVTPPSTGYSRRNPQLPRDPPDSAAGLEGDYERHLAWYILIQAVGDGGGVPADTIRSRPRLGPRA